MHAVSLKPWLDLSGLIAVQHVVCRACCRAPVTFVRERWRGSTTSYVVTLQLHAVTMTQGCTPAISEHDSDVSKSLAAVAGRRFMSSLMHLSARVHVAAHRTEPLYM